jgi:hypothetical protein
MSIPASGLRPRSSAAEFPQQPATQPCDPETATCRDAQTGGPARATQLPQTCDNGAAMGTAERVERAAQDSYERAEDPSRTCSQCRIDRLLQGGAADRSMPLPSALPNRPTTTVAALAASQRGNVAASIAGHTAVDLGKHVGIEVTEHLLVAAATRAGLVAASAALPPLAVALGIVMTAQGVMGLVGHAVHVDARDRAALSALSQQWQTYQCSVDANGRAELANRLHSIARGIELARSANLDDPFVQRQIESDPYVRLGARTVLEAQGRANLTPESRSSDDRLRFVRRG